MSERSSEQNAGSSEKTETAKKYWRANLKLLAWLLVIWFGVSFGAGILFVEELNAFYLFDFPLGFWFAQQGSIYVFVVLIFVYWRKMQQLERDLGIADDDVAGEDA